MASQQQNQEWLGNVLHPGQMILDYLESYDWTQRELGRRSGITFKTVSEICSGKTSISPDSALRLENVLRRPARFWLSLQRMYDESVARQSAEKSRMGWESWAKSFPIAEMISLELIPAAGNVVDNVLSFFGVASPEAWSAVFQNERVAFRQAHKYQENRYATAAWIRATEIYASEINVSPYDSVILQRCLSELRSVTRAAPEIFVSSIQSICATAGVAVVWMPALKNTGISGCARWLSDSKAMIALTLRYKTDDQLWFTFFHELGHILLHKKKHGFILDNAQTLDDEYVDPEMRKQEAEADQFAGDILIPPNEFSLFIQGNEFSSEAIYEFAETMGISPGIVVGRLQRERLLGPGQGNKLKRKLALAQVEG